MQTSLKQLFQMQKELDQSIVHQHQLSGQDLSQDKFLALLVELGELANETRCFKFWSLKGPSDHETILMEYVDGFHFLLSLGLDFGFDMPAELVTSEQPSPKSQTAAFLQVYAAVDQLKNDVNFLHYQQLFAAYLALGDSLTFSFADIEKAYYKKNNINHQRQEQGY
ncbi:dUTP diphosphatase [Tuberibacillus sp. Marseille-P3662]|uniref:dUTP diphosphatase n=1 Tax=Tuberibacillus sp. Marseille-P3662 TaxID=1965358 RepID=UPI000A1CDF82|nr:dUTP diphosphatase [Tuberibacillus sp. Marseille-P3662]